MQNPNGAFNARKVLSFIMRMTIVILLGANLLTGTAIPALADPPASQPATAPTDAAEIKTIRNTLVDWDTNSAKMSLAEMRQTYHTENDREAVYADWLAHESWEAAKTEQAVRDKWGADGDTQFARAIGGSTREEDQVCDVKIDGNHATVSWNIKEMKPQSLIKVDGHWLTDLHAMFDGWLKDDPNMETDHRPTGKLMKQAVEDINADKFDDVESFVKDFQTKLQSPTEGN